jgi:hypothetical protein
MNELLANPMFQSGVAPFIASLLLGLILYRTVGFWAAISVTAGFYLSAWLITDLKFFPLTSTRKVLLLGLVALGVGLLFDLYRHAPRWLLLFFFAAGAGAVVWIVWPVLTRKSDEWETWVMVVLSAVYVGWLMTSFITLRDKSERAVTGLLALAGGTGICALLAASALLGQLASAIAAALAAYLLAGLLSSRLSAGGLLVVPTALLCGLLGVTSLVYAKLPWYTLLILAAIPLVARVPLPEERPQWLKIALLLLCLAPVAGGAIYLTWLESGDPLF